MKNIKSSTLYSIIVLFILIGCRDEIDYSKIHYNSRFPVSDYPSKIGKWPTFVNSGGGYFYDGVLEYRVWCHPENGAEDIDNGNDYYFAFPTYEMALSFSKKIKGAEEPLILVGQWEHVNEPQPGVFEYIKGERITEWQVD
jgi:hypothetical protein